MAFPIRRGTNISHWLYQSKVRSPQVRGEARRKLFTRDDVKRLADIGVDHLRIPVDEAQLWVEDGTRETEAWDLLNEGLDWCHAEGLQVVVDLHILRSHPLHPGPEGRTLFKSEAAVARFADCWRELSRALRSRPLEMVAYEILNEPVAENHEDWNRVLRAAHKAIREEEPERMIAIGSNLWNSPATYPHFSPPADDPNIVLVFHFYEPFFLTHYGAAWSGTRGRYQGPIQYPGTPVPEDALAGMHEELAAAIKKMNQPFDIAAMERSIQPALEKSRALHLPLWCNEFGVYDAVPDTVRRAWYRDFLTVLETHRIPWTNWDYRGRFGLFDREDRPTVVLDVLFGRRKRHEPDGSM